MLLYCSCKFNAYFMSCCFYLSPDIVLHCFYYSLILHLIFYQKKFVNMILHCTVVCCIISRLFRTYYLLSLAIIIIIILLFYILLYYTIMLYHTRVHYMILWFFTLYHDVSLYDISDLMRYYLFSIRL